MKEIKYIILYLVPVPLVKKLRFLRFRFRFHNAAFCPDDDRCRRRRRTWQKDRRQRPSWWSFDCHHSPAAAERRQSPLFLGPGWECRAPPLRANSCACTGSAQPPQRWPAPPPRCPGEGDSWRWPQPRRIWSVCKESRSRRRGWNCGARSAGRPRGKWRRGGRRRGWPGPAARPGRRPGGQGRFPGFRWAPLPATLAARRNYALREIMKFFWSTNN